MTDTPPPRPDALPWTAVKALFDELLDLPAVERERHLARSSQPPAVCAEVRALLALHDAEERSAAPFLSQPPLPLAGLDGLDGSEAPGEPGIDRQGQRLGPWQLDTLLGRGGMAEVWAAHRADGAYDARVAVKLLRPGIGNAAVLARFAGEQRILARLEHPHIARLLDADRAPDGTPYFVMEQVPGQPIDAACAGRPLREVLALFLQLTDAVAFAHRHLLVHRDLKPGNVLVVDEDGGPGRVKLLDFGIAKALDPLEATDSVLTQAGERPLTPHYASPEQVRGDPVGTATDVYSLGVVLYELLTGQRPYGGNATGAREVLQAVLQAEPRPPGDTLPPGDARARSLRGDLGRIVMKALARPIDERYASVDALAADLRAWLDGRPVSARAPSAAYLMRRFLARHRVPVALSALALLTLLGALVALVHQVRETQAARAQAERRFAQARALSQRLLFDHHDKIVNLAGALPAREALLADARRYLDTLTAEVGDDAALARELAETHFRIAALQGETFSPSQERLDAAEASLDQALRLQPLYLGRADLDPAALPPAVDMWLSRSLLHTRRARLQPALQALQQAQPLAERMRLALGETQAVVSRLATLEGRLGLLKAGAASLASLGRVDEAAPHYARSTALMERLVAREPAVAEWQHQLAWAVGNQQVLLLLQGRWDEALAAAERALALRRSAAAARPDDHHLRYQALVYQLRLGSSLAYAGQHERARQALDEVDAATRRLASAEPDNRSLQRDLAVFQVVRGRAAALAGRLADATRHLDDALRTLPAAQGGDFLLTHWHVEARLWRARVLGTLADADAAALLIAATPPDPDNAARAWAVGQIEDERAALLQRAGRGDEAATARAAAAAAWAGRKPALFSVGVKGR